MAGIKIPIYEQTQTPQGAVMPVNARANNGAAEGLQNVGRALAGVAKMYDDKQEQDAKVEAATRLAEHKVAILQNLHDESLSLGKDDPTGFAGKFNEGMQKLRDETLAATDSKNPYLHKYLKAGFQEVQRDGFVQALGVEDKAISAWRDTQAGKLMDSGVKIVSFDPSQFSVEVEKFSAAIDSMSGKSAGWKQAQKDAFPAAAAQSSLALQVDDNPTAVLAILKNKDDPRTAALSSEGFAKLYEAADSGDTNIRAQSEGTRIADVAFGGGGEKAMNAEIDKIKDPVFRDIVAKNARAQYNIRESAKRDATQHAVESWSDKAVEAADAGKPFTVPVSSGLGALDRQQIVDIYERTAKNKADTGAGYAKFSNDQYRDSLFVMMFDPASKPDFLRAYVDKSQLTKSDYTTLRNAQLKMTSERTSVSDVGGYVDRVTVESGLATKDNKDKIQSWKMVIVDAVSQFEDANKRPALPEEIKKIAADSFQQAFTKERPWYKGGDANTTYFKELDPAVAPILSAGLVGTDRAITPANIMAMQAAIDDPDNRKQLEASLESQGIPVTKQSLANEFVKQLRANAK